MTAETALPVTERLRVARRDGEAARRRSLLRRSYGRLFYDYLTVVPHVFLRKGRAVQCPLRRPAVEVIAALRGEVVWTLDTASRLRYGIGLFRSRDLMGYCSGAEHEVPCARARRGRTSPTG